MPFPLDNIVCLAISILHIVGTVALLVKDVPATQEGLFRIQNCGPGTSTIQNLLRRLPDTLQPAIEDSSRFVASDAYATFFKNIVYASYVRDILSNASIGAPVPEISNGASPWIFCITGLGQVISGTNENPGENYYSIYLSIGSPASAQVGSRDAPFIFLYPSFWNYPSVPSASPSTCLTVLPHFNRYKQNGKEYLSYQLWILLHELVHHYTDEYSREAEGEFGDVNECLRLPARRAVLNPQSYLYYVANIYTHCTDFPARSRPMRPIELLEVNPNTTIVNNSRHKLP